MRALVVSSAGNVATLGIEPPRVSPKRPRVRHRPWRNPRTPFRNVTHASSSESNASGSSPVPDASISDARFGFPDLLGLSDSIEARAPRRVKRGAQREDTSGADGVRATSSPRDLLNVPSDLAPVLERDRTWSAYDIVGLWIGLVVCVPAWRLAASFAHSGATAAQAAWCIFLANAIVTIPMIASAQMGTKYGVPFPILVRAAFGVKGAKFPALLRAVVGCGWFGIQTFVGGSAVRALFPSNPANRLARLDDWAAYGVAPDSAPGVFFQGASPIDACCYLAFLFIQLRAVREGVASIRTAERFAAPALLALTFAMFVWAWRVGGGSAAVVFGAAFANGSSSNAFASARFFPALSAVVGFWATMALNISDFSRFAKTQRAQAAGHAFGLVGFMTIFSVVAIAATSVARGVPAIRGDPSDPIALLASTAFSPIARLLAAFGVLAATLSTNIAANVVAPANAFLALGFFRETGAGDESRFRSASRLVAALGTVIAPWRLLRDAEGFVWVWLVGHAAVLAPVAGVFLAEYHVVRKRKLDIDGLYDDTDPSGPYWYADGVNVRAMVAFGVGALLCLPGFLDACGVGALWTAADGNGGAAAAAVARRFFGACYEYAWFVGFGSSAVTHVLLSAGANRRGALAAIRDEPAP